MYIIVVGNRGAVGEKAILKLVFSRSISIGSLFYYNFTLHCTRLAAYRSAHL